MAPMQLHLTRTFDDLPPERLWPVVADLAGYADHVTGLRATEVVSGHGIGCIRRCTNDEGQDWCETVTAWDEGRRFRVEVDTTSYPFPLRQLFRSFAGTWTVEPAGGGTRVAITFDADVRFRLLLPIVRRMARRSTADLEHTLRSYGDAARASTVAR